MYDSIPFIGNTQNGQIYKERKQISGCQEVTSGYRVSFEGGKNILKLSCGDFTFVTIQSVLFVLHLWVQSTMDGKYLEKNCTDFFLEIQCNNYLHGIKCYEQCRNGIKYEEDLSICGLCNLSMTWNQSPTDTKGQLYLKNI